MCVPGFYERARQRTRHSHMQIESIRQRLRGLGALPLHEQRVLRDWLQALPHDRGRRRPDDFLPKPLRGCIAGHRRRAARHGPPDFIAIRPTTTSARLLVGLADGQTVESVLLPRDGVCVSSQVGCAVGCQFCMTGRSGLIRQVSSGEIVAQVALAAHHPPGEESGLHGHGRAGAQPRQRDGRDRPARHRGQYRPQEPGVLDGRRSAAFSSGCRRRASSRRWRCRCTPPSRRCANCCCRVRRA